MGFAVGVRRGGDRLERWDFEHRRDQLRYLVELDEPLMTPLVPHTEADREDVGVVALLEQFMSDGEVAEFWRQVDFHATLPARDDESEVDE